MKYLFSILMFLSGINFCQAQEGVTIIENDKIGELMRSYIGQNHQETHIQAWRIQVVTTDDRRKMEQARAKFRSLYPNISTDWKQVAPWYMLKAGAYKRKLDLEGFLLQVKRNFPGAIPIMDQVEKTQLLSL